jgi:hypothetical protein
MSVCVHFCCYSCTVPCRLAPTSSMIVAGRKSATGIGHCFYRYRQQANNSTHHAQMPPWPLGWAGQYRSAYSEVGSPRALDNWIRQGSCGSGTMDCSAAEPDRCTAAGSRWSGAHGVHGRDAIMDLLRSSTIVVIQ